MPTLEQLPGGNFQNTCKVVFALDKLGASSRKQIAEATGLTRDQVGAAVQLLIKSGKIVSVPKLQSYPGARSTTNENRYPTKYETVPNWTDATRTSRAGQKAKTPGGKAAARRQSIAGGDVTHKFPTVIRNRGQKVAMLNRVLRRFDGQLTDRDTDLLHAVIGDYERID